MRGSPLLSSLLPLAVACSSASAPAPAVDGGARRDAGRDAGADVVVPPVDAHRGDSAGDARPVDARAEGTSHEAGADARSPADATFDSRGPDGGWRVASHDPAPQVVAYGGPVIAAPVFTSITFPGFDLTAEAEAIVDGLGATAYWSQTVAPYGVGASTATTPVEVTETAPTAIDDPGVQAWLMAKLGGADAGALPAPSANELYVVVYPSATTVTLEGAPVCQHFGGYHNTFMLSSGTPVTYAVIAECGADGGAAIPLSEALSHELTAAATDPYPLVSPAYASVDPADETWALLAGGGELPDLCSPFADSAFVPAGYPYTLERIWSNTSAAASDDPCQPALSSEVYFNAAPHLAGMATLNVAGTVYQVRGAVTPIGQPVTLEVDLFSDGPAAAWTVAADDLSATLGGGPYARFSWDATTGTNGTKLHLTVTPVAPDPYGAQLFEVTSTLGATTKRWFGVVAQN